MNSDRWQHATRLFHEALERPPAARNAFLDEMCGSDPDLRQEVASLLAAHDEAGDFIETPAIAASPEVLFEDQTLKAGDRLGPFTIERLIARGGMGVVYLASDARLGRRVALKLVPPELAHDDQLRERLHREARAAATLSHPAIAQVFALEQLDDRLVIVGEFVDGETLRVHMRGKPLPLNEVVDIGLTLADALAAAHARGIIHRDLKPDNIMRTADGRLKVLDFGLARLDGLASGTASSRLTVSGVALGTPGYMSPEQREGREVDARTDIYALGVLLGELATGRPPASTDSDPALDQLTRTHPALAVIVRKCVHRRPEDRYQTAEALRRELSELQKVQRQSARMDVALSPSRDARWWWMLHQGLCCCCMPGASAACGG